RARGRRARGRSLRGEARRLVDVSAALIGNTLPPVGVPVAPMRRTSTIAALILLLACGRGTGPAAGKPTATATTMAAVGPRRWACPAPVAPTARPAANVATNASPTIVPQWMPWHYEPTAIAWADDRTIALEGDGHIGIFSARGEARGWVQSSL